VSLPCVPQPCSQHVSFQTPYFSPLILSLNFPEHLNVTTRLGASTISSPVAGFRPFRSRFSLTQNLPNPEFRTSSPDARVDLISSRIVSTVSVDFCRVNPFCSAMALIIWDFVRVTADSFGLHNNIVSSGAPTLGQRYRL